MFLLHWKWTASNDTARRVTGLLRRFFSSALVRTHPLIYPSNQSRTQPNRSSKRTNEPTNPQTKPTNRRIHHTVYPSLAFADLLPLRLPISNCQVPTKCKSKSQVAMSLPSPSNSSFCCCTTNSSGSPSPQFQPRHFSSFCFSPLFSSFLVFFLPSFLVFSYPSSSILSLSPLSVRTVVRTVRQPGLFCMMRIVERTKRIFFCGCGARRISGGLMIYGC